MGIDDRDIGDNRGMGGKAADDERHAAALERLSALLDGELDAIGLPDAARVCSEWRESEQLRASWHAYHLIGDVLRSDDLACGAAADTAFLVTLRSRMMNEPVVLAPRPLISSVAASGAGGQRVVGGWWRSWGKPSAVAAGMVVVVGVVLLTRLPASAPPTEIAAVASHPALSLVTEPTSAPNLVADQEPQAQVANGQLIRDARLDRYLAAHKQFAGSSALGIPSGFLRNATMTESER